MPVPRSAMRSARWRDPPASIAASAASTTVSVSGRGTSVAGVSRSGRPQNSLTPSDARDRLAAEPARRERRRSRAPRSALKHASGVGGERRVIEAERMADQDARIEIGRVEAGAAETSSERAPRGVPRRSSSRHASASAASSSAWCSATSASIDLAERFAFDHLRQLVERQVDAVVGDAALREIVGADALGAVAASRSGPCARRRARRRACCARRRRAWRAASPSPWRGSCAASAPPARNTTMPVGRWVMRIADSVLLTCWPPAPLGPHGVDLEIVGLISMSTSSASGSTATVAAEVWMRPCASVSGTRCTRCTPDSNFSLANAPRPRISATISLKPPLVPSLVGDDLGLPALLGGVALVHPEQVAGEQRGLVAAGAGADFQDHVALVHRVLRHERERSSSVERGSALSSSAGFSASAISRIVGVGLRDRRSSPPGRRSPWRPSR